MGCKINYKGHKALTRYLYECEDCGSQQDELHSIRDNPTIKCNNCGSVNTFRVIVAPRFHLKGSGFPSKEHKIDKEIAEQDALMREGFRSQAEIDTAKAMYEEREARLVKEGRKTISSIREKEIVEEKLNISNKQFEAVDRQIHKTNDQLEKTLLRKQLNQMEQKNGSTIKRERTKKVGKEALSKAAKAQSKLVGI